MSKVPKGLEDLIAVDAGVIEAIQNKNREKATTVLSKKSKRIDDELRAEEERVNAEAIEFEALAANKEHLDHVKVYVAHNLAAVAPIDTLNGIEADIDEEIEAIRAKYADTHREAKAAVDVAMHNVREARVVVEDLEVSYPNVLASEKVTLPSVAARLNKRGRGRGRGGAATPNAYGEGDTVYLQHKNRDTGERFVWESKAGVIGVMIGGVDTADSTAVYDLRTGVDQRLADMTDPPYHPGKAWKTYPPSGKAFEGVEIVNVE